MGFAVSTSSRRCVGTFSSDGAGSALCGGFAANDCVVGTCDGAAARDGELDLNAINSDGFQLIVDDQAVEDITVFWQAWGGDDITNVTLGDIAEPAADGNTDHTATGFVASATDQAVMVAGVQSTAAVNSAQATDSGLYIGFCTSDAETEGIFIGGNSDDGSATMDTDGMCNDGICGAQCVLGGGAYEAFMFPSFLTDTFRVGWNTVNTTNRRSIYMAIKGGSWHAGNYTINGNSGGATATVSGLSFTPKGIHLIGIMGVATATGNTEDRLGSGCGSSTSSRRSMGVWDETATLNAEINTALEYDSVLCFPSNAGALAASYDINAMNSDGFQIIVDTAGGVASEWQGYLAFGDAPAAGDTVDAPTRTHTYSPVAPQVRARVQPAQVTHTYTAQTPTVAITTTVAAPATTHTYTALAPQVRASVMPGAVEHSYIALAPQVQARVQPGAAAHTYLGVAPSITAGSTVQPGAAVHSYSQVSPQVQARVQPDDVAHQYAGVAPAITAGSNVAPASATHAYSALTPQARASVMPGPVTHSYTALAPAITSGVTVTVGTVSHTYTGVVPDVQFTPPAPQPSSPTGRPKRKGYGYSPVPFLPNKRELEIELRKEPERKVAPALDVIEESLLTFSADCLAEAFFETSLESVIVFDGLAELTGTELEVFSSGVVVLLVGTVQSYVLAEPSSEAVIGLTMDAIVELEPWARRPITDAEALDALRKLDV